jgi:uncharacterized OB-fold protein
MQIAKHWRLKGPRYRLEGAHNRENGAFTFPPPVSSGEWEPVTLNGQGVIESFASVERAAEGFTDGTIVALVRLAEGPLVTAQLTDVALGDVRIGMPVEMVTRKLRELGPDGLIVYGYKFRPCLEQL